MPDSKKPSERRSERQRVRRGRFAGVRHEVHVLDYLNVINRYKYVGLSVFLLVMLGALVRSYTTTPLYRAAARLMIELEDDHTEAIVPALSNRSVTYWQDPKIYYETQYRILGGADLAHRVAQRLDPSHAPAQPEQVDQLLSHVSVQPIANSRLVDVAFVASDPAFAARAANAIAEEYVEQNLEFRRRSLTGSLEWLSQEVAAQEKKVEASEQAMAQYREDQHAFSLEERQNIVVSRLNQLNEAVTRAKTARMQKSVLWNQVNALGADASADTVPAIRENHAVEAIRLELTELNNQKATLLQRYGEKYPDVVKITASLQDASRRLQIEQDKAINAIRGDYEAALSEEQMLTAALDAQKAEAADLSRKSAGYTVLDRDAHSNRQIYEALLLREKEMRVLANSRGNNVRLVDAAKPPGAPITPTLRRDLTLAAAAGLVLSLGLVFLLSYLDDTVKTPDDVTDGLSVPLLGLAPKAPSGGQLLSIKITPEVQESFRSLRTALSFINGNGNGSETGRTVIVTSARPLEGKTTTACNLALTLSSDGARVLLIDADMRRCGVHRALKIRGRAGLSDLLNGTAAIPDVLVRLPDQNVWVIPAGRTPTNPPDLIGSPRMKTLLDEARGRFEWVILDTPPVLAVTDAVLLTRLVNGVAFVIGSEMTRREHAARALDTLVTGGPGWVGVVLNRVDFKRNRYYYSHYSGYQATDYSSDSAHVA